MSFDCDLMNALERATQSAMRANLLAGMYAKAFENGSQSWEAEMGEHLLFVAHTETIAVLGSMLAILKKPARRP